MVKVSGVYLNDSIYKCFSFCMDRNAKSKPAMIKKYYEMFEIFRDLDDLEKCPIVPNYEIGASCDTAFLYKLESNYAKENMSFGIKNCCIALGLALIFNPIVKMVTLKDAVAEA